MLHSRPTMSLRELIYRLVPRRTFSVSQTRAVALGLLCAAVIIGATLIAHALLFPTHPHSYRYRGHQQRTYHAKLYNHHNAKTAVPRKMQPSAYSFAQHPSEELGALVAFLAALASNSLPLSTNPHAFLDPDLVLAFDTRADDASSAVSEVQAAVAEAWASNPVVVFSELSTTAAPASREMKSIFSVLALSPEATIFEVDQRVDVDVLRPLLQRLTRLRPLPIALVGGTAMTLNELRAERDAGTLKAKITQAGAVVDGASAAPHGRKH